MFFNEDDVRAAAREIVLDVLELDEDELEDGTDFFDDLGATSLQFLDLTVALEKRFKLRFQPSEAHELTSLDEIVRVTAPYLLKAAA